MYIYLSSGGSYLVDPSIPLDSIASLYGDKF